MQYTIPTIENVKSAKDAIKKYINITPLINYPILDKILDAEVWIKHENFQMSPKCTYGQEMCLEAPKTRTEHILGAITSHLGRS